MLPSGRNEFHHHCVASSDALVRETCFWVCSFAPPFPSLPLPGVFWDSSIWHKCVGAPWCNHVPTDGPMHRHTHLRILKPLKSLRNRAYLSSLRLLVSCALLFQFRSFRFWRRLKGGLSQYWRGSKRTGLHNAREHLVASVVTSEHDLSQCSTCTFAFVEMTALSLNPVPGMTNSVRCLVGNSPKTHKLAKSHKSTNAIVIWCSLETILKRVLECHAQDKRHVVVPSIDTIGADDRMGHHPPFMSIYSFWKLGCFPCPSFKKENGNAHPLNVFTASHVQTCRTCNIDWVVA